MSSFREKIAIGFVPPDCVKQCGRRPARHSQPAYQQPVPRHARPAFARDGRESGLHPAAPRRRVKALWHDNGNKGRHGGNQAGHRKLNANFSCLFTPTGPPGRATFRLDRVPVQLPKNEGTPGEEARVAACGLRKQDRGVLVVRGGALYLEAVHMLTFRPVVASRPHP